MTKTVRWGILGAAHFAKRHMAPAMQLARNTELVALGTSDGAKAAPFKALAPGLKVHSSYDAVLNDPDIDAVYIPLPNHLHVAWVKKAIAAGKHVLCEKPIAMQASEIDELIALRDSAGLMLVEAYMIVHHPQWQYAKALFESGVIGDLVQVDGVFSYNNAEDVANIRNRPDTGGGSLPDIGVYTFGSARYVTGQEPEAILDATITWENGVDVWAGVTAQFPGFRFMGVTSMRMDARQEMNFHGTNGFIRLTAPFNPQVFGQAEVELHQGGEAKQVKRFPNENHYTRQLEAFQASLHEGADYPCPLEFSQGTQRMIDQVFQKARG